MIYRKKLHFFIISLLLLSSTFIHATNPGAMTIKLLGINDFHGQISTGKFINNEPVGGAAVLASYLKQAQSGMEDQTIITIMGDLVSASPPAS